MHHWRLLLFAAGLVAFSEMKPLKSISEDMDIIVKCNASFPVNKKTLNMVLVDKRFEDHVSHNFKCFLHCLYYNYEWMDVHGNIRHHAVRMGLSESTLGDPAIKYLISTCSEIGQEDKCEKAFVFTQCFWMENAKLEEFSSSSEWEWMNFLQKSEKSSVFKNMNNGLTFRYFV